MEIIQFKEIEIWKRIIFLKMLTDKVQKLIDEENYENYEKVLNAFRDEITNIDIINSLDKIKLVPNVKVNFIKSVVDISEKVAIDKIKYINLLEEYKKLFKSDNENNFNNIIKEEDKFNKYLKEKENIIENLLIYLIYKHFMNALYTKDLNEEINNIIISYAMIKMLLLGRWYKNNKSLSEEDFVEVFYIFSRVIEHNKMFLNKIYEGVKEVGYDKIAYTTILVH